MRRLFSLIVLAAFAATMTAQTTEWLVEPQYDELKFFASGMYKATKDGKVGLLSADGRVILPVSFSAISLFYEGMAVAVDNSDKGWQVKGAVTDEGSVNYADSAYYLIPGYMFYSEGMLPVQDSEGRFGYLDDKCRPAFAFTTDSVRPFSEGLAAVGDGESFHWIDTQGESIVPWLSNGGTPFGGTNFYKGVAYLWDEDGDMFVLNEDGSTKRIKDSELYVDYLYRVGTGKEDTVEYTHYVQEFEHEWKPSEHNGKWSYLSPSGKLTGPYQYEAAGMFSDGSAVAKKDGKYGLLHIVADESTFYLSATGTKKKFESGKAVPCDFDLSVPSKWRGQPLTVTVTDGKGNKIKSVQPKGDKYIFSYMPDDSGQRTFAVSVASDGIKLWEGKQTYSFKKIEHKKTLARIRLINDRANERNQCQVVASITNPSSEPVNVTVMLSGGGKNAHFAERNKSILVPANRTITIKSWFTVVDKVVLGGWAKVTISDGSVARATFDLSPFA